MPAPTPAAPAPDAPRLRSRPSARTQTLWRALLRATLLPLVASVLLVAVTGGLLRAGVHWPVLPGPTLAGTAASWHAALMVSGFLGTVIGIERAVALKQRWAFAAPLASLGAALLMLAGRHDLAVWLALAAALVFIGVNVVLVRRQPAPHTRGLLFGALAWGIGNALLALGFGSALSTPWWFAFLVLTIVAERLEMTRLMRQQPLAQPLLQALVGWLLVGAALPALQPELGAALYGLALAGLGAWGCTYDIARRTVRAQGLSRYMALCLLGGYGWLAVAGLAWAATPLWPAARDTALHALGLGFVISMVMAHAPVILPAVARIKLLFGPWFYFPLGLLQAGLLLRCAGGLLQQPDLRATGAALNALTLAAFALTVIGSAIAWQWQGRPRADRHATPRTPPP